MLQMLKNSFCLIKKNDNLDKIKNCIAFVISSILKSCYNVTPPLTKCKHLLFYAEKTGL